MVGYPARSWTKRASEYQYSSADFLANQSVLTGSFNFTKAAQTKNAEIPLMLRDPALAARYAKNWEAHRQHSQPSVGRGMR
jgi:phosphatidylserine/phosphatidylglycerophosphate/cardiolipin synthase-like enzyme